MWLLSQQIFYHYLFLVVSLDFLGWRVETVSLPGFFLFGLVFGFFFFISNLMKLQLRESKWDSISLWDLATELFTVLQSLMFKVQLLTA